MGGKSIAVPFTFGGVSGPMPPKLSLVPVAIMRNLLDRGYSHVELVGFPAEHAASNNIIPKVMCLWIELDVAFLLDGYLYLEDIIANNQFGEHHLFLADGAIQISAKRETANVLVRVNQYVGLRIDQHTFTSFTATVESYLGTWRRIAHILFDASVRE